MCRHHIQEPIIQSVSTSLFEVYNGSNIPLFVKFQNSWPSINKNKFESLTDSHLQSSFSDKLRKDASDFLKNILYQKEDCYLPRDDYKEMEELCMIILGEVPAENYQFKVPGAYHLAQWMAKVIYYFKIYLFRDQFAITSKEENSRTSESSVNDLLLFQQLK